MSDLIYDLLKQGKTEDELIKEIAKAKKKIAVENAEAKAKAAKEAEKKKKIESARGEVLKAMKAYLDALGYLPTDEKEIEDFEKSVTASLKSIEDAAKRTNSYQISKDTYPYLWRFLSEMF